VYEATAVIGFCVKMREDTISLRLIQCQSQLIFLKEALFITEGPHKRLIDGVCEGNSQSTHCE